MLNGTRYQSLLILLILFGAGASASPLQLSGADAVGTSAVMDRQDPASTLRVLSVNVGTIASKQNGNCALSEKRDAR